MIDFNQHAGIFLLTSFCYFFTVYRLHSQNKNILCYVTGTYQLVNAMCLPYLQPNLLINSDRSIAEGDGVTEAGLSLDSLLGHVHDDLRALGAGVEE